MLLLSFLCAYSYSIFIASGPLYLHSVLDSNDINVDFSSIKYASKMTNLDLSSTGLFSVNGINQAPTLLSLDISRNDFKSSIPKEIFQISTLQQLFMGNNEFDTSLPSDIGDLQQLRLFSCASSMLTGPLPKNLGNLKELVHLNLEENALTGALPIELESMENLAFVDISGNALDGELLSFSSLNNLRRVDLSKNAFSKSIPDDFLASVNPLFFDFVDLRGNFLTGVVPSILSHFDVIYLQNNLISGIDSELCDEARGGLIKQFECDAILCPPGTFNAIGR